MFLWFQSLDPLQGSLFLSWITFHLLLHYQYQYYKIIVWTAHKSGGPYMRLMVIQHLKNEKLTYNPEIFQKNEDLIIFPFKEFDKFYNETMQSLIVISKLIKESLDPSSTSNPHMDLNHVQDWINLIQEDMDLLLKFNEQTTLHSFKNRPPVKREITRRVDELSQVNKEEIQCLMGL